MRPKDRHLLPSISHPVPVRSGAGGNQLLSKFIPSTLSSTLAAFTSSAFAAFIFLFSLTLLSAGCNRDDEHSGKYSAKGGEITFIATGGNPSAFTKSSADVLSSGASLSAGTHSLSASGGNSIEGEKTYKIYYDFDKGENVEAPASGSSRDADGNLTQSSDTRFSGEVFTVSAGTSLAERINWVEGKDKITIFECKSGEYSNYSVETLKSNNREKSTASLVPVTGNGLQWHDGDDHKFLALYPSIDDLGISSPAVTYNGSSSPYSATVKGARKVIPADQYCTKVEGGRNYKSPNLDPSKYPSGMDENWYEPKMEYAYMLSSLEVGASDPKNPVSLSFYPQFSSVEVKLFKPKDLSDEVKLKEAVLRGGNGASTEAALSGTPTLTLDGIGTDFTTLLSSGTSGGSISPSGGSSTTGNTITLSFYETDGITKAKPVLEEYDVSGSKPVSFTFLTMPSTDITQLELTLTLDIAGKEVSKTLQLKDGSGWIPLPAGKKLTITNMKTWDVGYIFQVPDKIDIYANGPFGVDSPPLSLTSYHVEGATITAQSITAEFSIDGTEWYAYNNVPAGSALADIIDASAGIDAFQLNAATDGVYKDSYLFIKGNPATPTEGADNRASRATFLRSQGNIQDNPMIIAKRESGGQNYVDLSYYNTRLGVENADPVHGAEGPITANSYIISQKGSYCLPLVYGNALDCSLVPEPPHYNTQAYDPTAASSSNTYLKPFQNGAGNGITSPYILEDRGIANNYTSLSSLNATIVWQDVAAADGFLTINGFAFFEIKGKAVPYILFTIDDNIQEGNVVIALRNSSNEILWSWHIWVTAEHLEIKTVTNHDGVETKLLPVPLGWNREATEIYPERRFYVRFTQQTSGQQKVAEVIQHEGPYVVGNAPFYQWGRKDPFLPGSGRDRENKNYSSPGGYSIVSSTYGVSNSNNSSVKIALSIRSPYVMYAYTGTTYTGWIGNRATPFNLWDANQSSLPEPGYGSTYYYSPTFSYRAVKPVKTIYDPCPQGFSVPRDDFATGFTTSGENAYSYNSSPGKSQQNVLWNKDSGGGVWVKCNSSDTEGLFIPFIGARHSDGGTLMNVSRASYHSGVCIYTSSHHLGQTAYFTLGHNLIFSFPSLGITLKTGYNTAMANLVFPAY